MLADKDATLRQLRHMLLKAATTEKTRAVLERAGIPGEGGKPVRPTPENRAKDMGASRRARLWPRRRWRFLTPCSSRAPHIRSA
jgi:hypothetical protein